LSYSHHRVQTASGVASGSGLRYLTARLRRRITHAVLLPVLVCLYAAAGLSQERGLVAELHAHPPPPCIAKAIDDRSSLIAITPDGNIREEVRGIMAGLVSPLLATGAQRMTADNIEVVYTAVFYEGKPINETGIYAYRFREPVDPTGFTATPELNGRLFVIDTNLLVILWHEEYAGTERCYTALEKALSGGP